VRLLKALLTLAKRARSLTDNSGKRYSNMISGGTSSRPVFCSDSDGMVGLSLLPDIIPGERWKPSLIVSTKDQI
jgi:hypothetical protein